MFKKNCWKSIMASMMAIIMCVGLCACNSEKNSETGFADDESVAYEIIWYYLGKSTHADISKVEAKVNEYVSDKINATVKMIPMDWGPYHEKISNVTNSGEKHDLRWLNSNSYKSGVLKGAFLDITELFETYAPKTRALFTDEELKSCMINGQLYAIPANKDRASYFSLVYRKDIADKYNMDMSNVKTLEDMYPYFDIIKEKETGMYAYAINGGGTPWYIYSGFESFALGESLGFLPGEDGKVKFFPETEEYKKYALQAKTMYDAGYLHKDCAVDDNAAKLKEQGKAFAWIEVGIPGKVNEVAAKYGYELGEIKLTEPYLTAVGLQGSMMAIPFSCENPVRVMKFVELLNTDPYLNNLICFGIEGEHYKKVSENRIEIFTESGYNNIGNQWVYGNQFINYLYGEDADDKWTRLDEFNKSAEVSPYAGFVADTDSVKSKINAVSSVIGKYNQAILYGAVDVEETIKKLNTEAKAAGVDEIITLVQTQYDDWAKDNK